MSTPEWKAVDDLFHEALMQSEEARGAFLAAQCGSDTSLRLAVERLLRAHDSASNFLNTAAADDALRAMARDVEPIAGSIGPYRPIREIGRGGMGAVYLAERADEQFRKVVAIKVIKRGMDTDAMLRRFHDERQILADLEHANIARLLDGGATDDGRPYLVMEYVDGDPLDRYCDGRRLDIDARLALFLQVCSAVSYAHQRLVIHCDIKPSNVVVANDGVPKLLDFGIARLMRPGAPETANTVFGFRGMTPEYASPEQLQSLRVDALSDVYSLGMLLCELLLGRLPFSFGTRTPGEIAAVITASDPLTPSNLTDEQNAFARRTTVDHLRRSVRGDLDSIVLTALARDRSERYQSVDRLADDVQAHLEGRPIAVRHERLYRALKFVRRNRLAVGAAALVSATLVAGIAATSSQAIRARRAERASAIAEQRSNGERDRALEAERVAPAARSTAEHEKNRAVEESKRADAESEAARAVTAFLQDDLLAQASTRAQANGNAVADPNLTVRTALDRASIRIEGKFADQPRIEAAIRQTIGTTYTNLGLYAEAQKHLERAVALRRTLDGASDRDTLGAMQSLGFVLHMQGKNAPAEAILRSVLDQQQRRFGPNSIDISETLNDLASTVSSMGRRQEAEVLHARVVDITRRAYGDDHPETLVAMNNLLNEYSAAGRYAEAESLGRRVLASKRRVLGDEHPSTLLSANTLAITYRNEGKYADAEALLLETLRIRRRVTGEDSIDTIATMNSLGNLLSAERRYTEAESLLETVIERKRKLLGDDNPETMASMNNLAEAYRREGKADVAEELFTKVLIARRKVLGVTHPNTLAVLLPLARIKLDQRRFAEAESFSSEAVRGYEQAKSDTWQRYYALSLLASSLAADAKYVEAEQMLTAAYDGLVRKRTSISAENLGMLDEVKLSIARLYEQWGKPDRAAVRQH
jgi:tetratricopeptide (TPR) repeat protein/tRNA A-37 threonylcarbamoyl transferase component Bud32